MLRIDVPVGLDAIAPAQAAVAAWTEAGAVPAPAAYRLALVLEELLANLAMHGRFDGPPPPVRLHLDADDAQLRAVIEDAAAPFDPREAPAPAPARLDDDRVGGLGLALVRKMADRLDYGRAVDGWNRTELAIRLDAGTG